MSETSIEWTERTWNPITGCTKVSAGCKNCYAETMACRLKAMGQSQYQNVINGKRWSGEVEFVVSALDKPRKRQKPTTYFVNSMSDLFHIDVRLEWLAAIWGVMARTPQHTYQILTKRAERMQQLADVMMTMLSALDNVWLGVSIENQAMAEERILRLTDTTAAVRFLSVEPLLGPVDLGEWINEIDWVIVGGESGPNARPIEADWVRGLRDQCQEAEVPFFFKQWGGKNKKAAGRLLDGQEWMERPGEMDGEAGRNGDNMIKNLFKKAICIIKKPLKKVVCDYLDRHWPDKKNSFILHGLRYPCHLCGISLYAKPGQTDGNRGADEDYR